MKRGPGNEANVIILNKAAVLSSRHLRVYLKLHILLQCLNVLRIIPVWENGHAGCVTQNSGFVHNYRGQLIQERSCNSFSKLFGVVFDSFQLKRLLAIEAPIRY